MLILIIEPDKRPETRDIEGGLKEMQNIVGGSIQAVYPFEDDVALISNDEAKLIGLPANRGLHDDSGVLYDIVCGTFFLCRAPDDSESFESLTEEQAERYKKYFYSPERFINREGRIYCVPTKWEVDNGTT